MSKTLGAALKRNQVEKRAATSRRNDERGRTVVTGGVGRGRIDEIGNLALSQQGFLQSPALLQKHLSFECCFTPQQE